MMTPQTMTTIRDHVAVLFKYKAMILGIIALTVLLVTAVSYILPDTYKATATLLVKPGRLNAPPQSVIPRAGIPSLYTTNLRREDVLSEIEILRSDVLIEQAIKATGPEVLSPPLVKGEGAWQAIKYYFRYAYGEIKDQIRELLYTLGLAKRITEEQRLLLSVKRNLSVQEIRNTHAISVTFSWPLPEPAARFLSNLLELYRGYHIKIHQGRRMLGFLDREVADAEQRLLAKEKELHDFRVSTGIASPEQQRSLLLNRRAELEARIETTRAKAAEIAVRLKTLAGQMDNEREQLAFGSGRAVQQELRAKYLDLQVELAGLKERQKSLEKDLKALNARLDRLDAQEIRLEQLRRERDLERENFMVYAKKREEIGLSAQMDASKIIDVAVVDTPEVPARPVRFIRFLPPKIFNILVALVGSTVIAVLLAFFRHYADDVLDTKRKVEKLTGLRVLASVPNLSRP